MHPTELRDRARKEIEELGPESSDRSARTLWREERRGAIAWSGVAFLTRGHRNRPSQCGLGFDTRLAIHGTASRDSWPFEAASVFFTRHALGCIYSRRACAGRYEGRLSCWASRSIFAIDCNSFQPIAPLPCTSGRNSQKVSP